MDNHSVQVVNLVKVLLSSRLYLCLGFAGCFGFGERRLAVDVTVHEVFHVEGAGVADVFCYFAAKDIKALDSHDQNLWCTRY